MAKSPFRDETDSNPSFSVNTINGLWRCMNCGRAGNYVMFRAILEAEEFDETTGLARPDYRGTELRLLAEFGLATNINPAYVTWCRDYLQQHAEVFAWLTQYKPWNLHTLGQLDVGFDPSHGRVVIPIRDHRGKLVNCRMYKPNAERTEPKIMWLTPNLTGNFLFPWNVQQSPYVILTEGEADALTLQSLGYPGGSGTMGADAPVPEGLWWTDKDIFSLTDADDPGQRARESIAHVTRLEARSVTHLHLPDWPAKVTGKSHGSDISDCVKYYLELGYDVQSVQLNVFGAMFAAGEALPAPHAVYDQDAREVPFSLALNADLHRNRVKFTGQLISIGEPGYVLPLSVRVRCPARGHDYCASCPMSTQHRGDVTLRHDPRSPSALKLVQATEIDQLMVYKQQLRIPKQCPEPVAETESSLNLTPVLLGASSAEATDFSLQRNDQQRHEGFIVRAGDQVLEENTDYEVEGFVYPTPKQQQSVVLVDRYRTSRSIFTNFEMTPAVRQQLEVFQPSERQSSLHKLKDIAADFTDSVTQIYGREDLHLAYLCVWHSAVGFTFAGSIMPRGWLECLVLGDTRCGKTSTFSKMAEWYGIGTLIDCKNQTPAGILGSVETSPTTGKRYVVSGLLPRNDNRVVGYDEFHQSGWARSIIEILSSTRSEGVVRITKAAHAQLRARVRSIWMANAGAGRNISETGQSGVALIARLIRQPEDIARFDLALTVTQEEVPSSLINQAHLPSAARYGREANRTLLGWIYSRKPEQITFTPEAEADTIRVARAMFDKYTDEVPLVEPSSQRLRVAKLAAAVAGQCFSCDDAGEALIVRAEHVYAAQQLFSIWYDKASMGYDRFSERSAESHELIEEANVQSQFDELGSHASTVAEELLRLDCFTEKIFGTLAPSLAAFGRSFLAGLYSARAIRVVHRGQRDAYEITPQFAVWLNRYLEVKRHAKNGHAKNGHAKGHPVASDLAILNRLTAAPGDILASPNRPEGEIQVPPGTHVHPGKNRV